MSRFAFVNPGGPLVPDLAKARRYRITRFYWEAEDTQVDADLLRAVREAGFEVGIMRDPHWTNESAIDLARTLDADLIRLGSGNSQCAVLADIEYHDASYVMAFLEEWRQLRPRRVTGWTLEPMQGGWFTSALTLMLAGGGITVYPQAYYGNMTPEDVDLVRCNLIEAGIPRGMCVPVYSAAAIPRWWDGIAFPFHKLP